MQEKTIIRLSLSFILLSFPLFSQGMIAYIPQALRECIGVISEVAKSSSDTRNLQELHTMIKENRILASDDMTRKAVEEALYIVKRYKNTLRGNKHYEITKKYLKKYLDTLDDASVLLAMQREGAHSISWPMSFVERSLPNYSVAMDMMHLSSELTLTNNIPLCGNVEINFSSDNDVNRNIIVDILKFWHFGMPKDPSIIFNANAMTNSLSSTPSIIFGTGVSSPIINAWPMASSMLVQSPINMQFSIPSNLKLEADVSLELHFLVKKQWAPAGKACIRVDAKYIHNHADFDILAADPTFTYTNYSTDFIITEPTSDDSLRHVSVVIPLDSSVVHNLDLALLSITRVAPHSHVEYGHDIYLASAAFRYTRNNFI